MQVIWQSDCSYLRGSINPLDGNQQKVPERPGPPFSAKRTVNEMHTGADDGRNEMGSNVTNNQRKRLQDCKRAERCSTMNSTHPASERRERQRFGVHAPLTVLVGQRALAGFTRDLSNRGVYFFLDPGENALLDNEFEFTVELPPEITLSSCCSIRCQGHVVRRDSDAQQMTGIAAEILHYSIQRDAAA